jgi:2-polyprenyl-3-methyl-5-hydroxy-6-metoxy-1,4-benzoquinol methylase
MHRSKASAPAKYLEDQGLIRGRALDYGCGRGKDAEELGTESYDPYYAPELPEGRFDTILCTYVLNVVAHEEEEEIIRRMEGLLRPGGVAYITVRRDVGKGWVSASGSTQRRVELDLPVTRKCSKYCIYLLEAE